MKLSKIFRSPPSDSCYLPEVYFSSEIEDKNKEMFAEIVTLNLTMGAAFLIAITGVNCNAPIDTGAKGAA